MRFISSIQFVFSHVYREGNGCADTLSKFGANSNTAVWCPPPFLRGNMGLDRAGLPQFRFK